MRRMTFPLVPCVPTAALRGDGAAPTLARQLPPPPAPRWRDAGSPLLVGAVALAAGAARAGDAQRRRSGVLDLGQRRPRRTTRPASLGAWFSDLALLLVRLFGLVGARSSVRAPGSARWRACCAATAARAAAPRRRSAAGLAVLARPGAAAGRERLARMDPAVPVGRRMSPAATPAACSATCSAARARACSASPARACSGSPRWSPASSLALRFSWLRVAERIGAAHRVAARAPGRAHRARRGHPPRRARRCASASDVRRGRAPAAGGAPADRHRADRWSRCRRATRVVKERQKPLFTELADTKLPQVDLLDAAPRRVETRQRPSRSR